MTLSNLSDRGTLRGTLSVGSESGGTDNYIDLINKPSINGNELVGDQSGDDLGLINSNDLTFNVGHAGNILHNIKYKDRTYTTYAEPFRGATSNSNGTMGLVRAPLASQGDYDKYLKGNGMWASIPTGRINYSTNEQVIGTWIDGSILYEKVFDLGLETDYVQGWHSLNIQKENINRIFDGLFISDTGLSYNVGLACNSTYIEMLVYMYAGTTRVTGRYIIARYTKSST